MVHVGHIELSGGNYDSATDLHACIGECDADSQCATGLKCFQRSNGEKIPGCMGSGGGKDWDYCYEPGTVQCVDSACCLFVSLFMSI